MDNNYVRCFRVEQTAVKVAAVGVTSGLKSCTATVCDSQWRTGVLFLPTCT